MSRSQIVENSEDSRVWAQEQIKLLCTSSFGMKMRIEKVGGNREGATVSCLRQLCVGEEKKMRFSRGEVVFHRLKIRSKTAMLNPALSEEAQPALRLWTGFEPVRLETPRIPKHTWFHCTTAVH
ncbi:hypothetical protein E2C01_047561 [Portunus trituberculatus]|uniref:Uncharacterized protein n=1 Tax=Portunus trituberculatus TaxID=210409 RepID=A0A5B7G8W3_PORTR|nr:hypothetical protein [Portunus trituberculatus]